MSTGRVLRSATKGIAEDRLQPASADSDVEITEVRPAASTAKRSVSSLAHDARRNPFKVVPLPPSSPPQNPGLRFNPYGQAEAPAGRMLLRAKRRRLQQAPPIFESIIGEGLDGSGSTFQKSSVGGLATALASTLIFSAFEAGTAVCVSRGGLVLTCAHCFGETEVEWRDGKMRWALCYTGQAVQLECLRWDPKADLALARIVAVELDSPALGTQIHMPGGKLPKGHTMEFSFVPIYSSALVSGTGSPRAMPRVRAPIVCFGQPGSEDLEVSGPPRKTDYEQLVASTGRYRGLDKDQDPMDCSEIGSLMHDAWTYWGHSGAPLVDAESGMLVGLHSSWDDATGMRRGVPAVAIRHFLGEHEDFEGVSEVLGRQE